MSVVGFLKSYWRIILLIIFVSVALVALFIPGGIFADDTPAPEGEDGTIEEDRSLTNLVFGLGLDGGTRISAPVVGFTAEGLEIDPDEADMVRQSIRSDLGLDTGDTMMRFDDDTGLYDFEIFDDSVSQEEFAQALRDAGVDVTTDDIRIGVTQETRDEMTVTIDTKINQAGLSGGRVSERTVGGEHFIVTEVPDRTPDELRSLLAERGVVEVVAHFPDEDGVQQNVTVLVEEDFDRIGSADWNERHGHHVSVTIQPESAPEFQSAMNEFGFTSEGVGMCPGREADFGDNQSGHFCLLTMVDGEVIDAHSMSPDLAQTMAGGDWAEDPNFVMLTPTHVDAQSLSVNLRAGSLRAPLDFDRDEVMMVLPALADQFKQFSLIIGIISVITVSFVVYLRYADARVAVPMIATAMSEVVILLGFAAAISMPLTLSHVAGFIAVIGTGVDDLIIIADEVMSRGDVNSRRVFHSRFRKAFWVIGAAAATTIIAMSPLAILDLGDLRGFAIITILGVMIGVLVTRPAYGDILRLLMTDR